MPSADDPWCEPDKCPASICGGPHVTRIWRGREITEHVDHVGELFPLEEPENVGPPVHHVHDTDSVTAQDTSSGEA
jgi:hypothetical protein